MIPQHHLPEKISDYIILKEDCRPNLGLECSKEFQRFVDNTAQQYLNKGCVVTAYRSLGMTAYVIDPPEDSPDAYGLTTNGSIGTSVSDTIRIPKAIRELAGRPSLRLVPQLEITNVQHGACLVAIESDHEANGRVLTEIITTGAPNRPKPMKNILNIPTEKIEPYDSSLLMTYARLLQEEFGMKPEQIWPYLPTQHIVVLDPLWNVTTGDYSKHAISNLLLTPSRQKLHSWLQRTPNGLGFKTAERAVELGLNGMVWVEQPSNGKLVVETQRRYTTSEIPQTTLPPAIGNAQPISPFSSTRKVIRWDEGPAGISKYDLREGIELEGKGPLHGFKLSPLLQLLLYNPEIIDH